MKSLLLLTVTCFMLTGIAFAQKRSGYEILSGKKIKSSLVRTTGPAGGDNSKAISVGSTTITSGNQATANNAVSRELVFRNAGNTVELERKMTHIKTRIKNPFGEMIVDTDNPFERPPAMTKLGEKYDNLVKQKAVTRFSNGSSENVNASKEFSIAWNEFVPYLTLDSSLNTTWFSLPANKNAGSSWTDTASNENISISVTYTIQQVKGDTLVVKCEGTNQFVTPKNGSNTNIGASVYRLQSVFEGIIKADTRDGFIYNASINALTKNRKLALGQVVDNDIKEEVSVTNTITK